MRLSHYDLSAGFLRCYVSIVKGANDRFPETQKHKMKKSAKTATATATATATEAFKFAPFTEAQAQLAQLVDALASRESANLKQIRAMWGFSLLIPFPKQWEDVPSTAKKRIREEALGLIKAIRPNVSESTWKRTVRTLGFEIRERESDPLATAKAQARATAKAHKAHGVSQAEFMAFMAECWAKAETKEV
jgi:hypothetical protein